MEFAALDTLQHGLARHAERAYRFAHWKKVVAGLADEAGPEIFGQSDPPRGAGCQLLAGDDAVIEQVDFPPWSGGVRSERHAAVRMVIRSMLARASAGVR